MSEVTIMIDQDGVWNEVAKLTDYVGAKSTADGGEDVRERVLITDGVIQDMSGLWTSALAAALERLKTMYAGSSISELGDSQLRFEVSKAFDTIHLNEVKVCLKNYLIKAITGQWFKIANKKEADSYLAEAEEYLTGAERLLYSRKRPTLPSS